LLVASEAGAAVAGSGTTSEVTGFTGSNPLGWTNPGLACSHRRTQLHLSRAPSDAWPALLRPFIIKLAAKSSGRERGLVRRTSDFGADVVGDEAGVRVDAAEKGGSKGGEEGESEEVQAFLGAGDTTFVIREGVRAYPSP